MNTLRLIAIALPVMFLMACGGGGGGTATVTPTTPTPMTMMPPGTNDPMNPPVNMPPTVMLPDYVVTPATARTHTGGTAPTSMTETQIVSAIQTRATAADTFEFSDFSGTPSVDITCSNTNKTCSGSVPDADTLTFSLAGIDDLSLVDDTGLVGFDSNTQAVMMDHGATIIQSQSAAGQNDGTHLTFQSYGGWLTNTVFGVERLVVTESGTDTTRYASFSFGDASGSNPTTGTLIDYTGVMIGTDTRTSQVVHGDAVIQFVVSNSAFLETVTFQNIVNLSNGAGVNTINFNNIPLAGDGTFESDSNDIKGTFYGTGHEGIGGIFNKSNILGAFGGKKI